MSSEVFVISSVRDHHAFNALRHAVEQAGLEPERIQDAVFGLDGHFALPPLEGVMRQAGLSCPAVAVSSSLRAIFYSSASILSDDVNLSAVVGGDAAECAAFVLASPDMVGRLNLIPRARLAARSLAGAEAALYIAELTHQDMRILKEGESGALLLNELLDELDDQTAAWGLVTVHGAALLVERL